MSHVNHAASILGKGKNKGETRVKDTKKMSCDDRPEGLHKPKA